MLYKKFKNKNNFSLTDVQNAEIDLSSKSIVFKNKKRFFITDTYHSLKIQLSLYEKYLSKYSKKSSNLVELGAGYGSKLFQLSCYDSLKHLKLIAGEFTDSGCKLIKKISSEIKKPVHVSEFDFVNINSNQINFPENSLIFTSYSLHYAKGLKENFIDYLLESNPSAIIFFEPIYDFFDEKSVHGLMCKKYMELNDYTTNLYSLISNGSRKNKMKLKIKKNIFGNNPFLPISVIEIIPDE